MRIVIDMQGAQSSSSWNRGIGRYTMSLVFAIIRNRGEHEVFLALNGAFPESISRIRASFADCLPRDSIRIWYSPTPTAGIHSANDWRRQSGELILEAFLTTFNPDIVLVSSLFEGLGDDAVTSIKRMSSGAIVAVILYDLIPLIHRKAYLNNPLVEEWYLEKAQHLCRADLWLAISESSRKEGCDHLGLPAERCISISSDADSCFQRSPILPHSEQILRGTYGLQRKFVMYTGGIDQRKNIEALVRAFALMAPQLRASHQLAIVCSVNDERRRLLVQLAKDQGLQKDDLVLTGFVPEDDLVALYNLCALFVFPSWHEGFGLPALEAMRCGAPVIVAHTSSLTEVVDLPEAMFDPYSDMDISRTMERGLADETYRQVLFMNGERQSAKFSWSESAANAISAMEKLIAERDSAARISIEVPSRPRLAYIWPLKSESTINSAYGSAILSELACFYEIEIIAEEFSENDAWMQLRYPIRSAEWFAANSDCYDRVLYRFGIPGLHKYMYELLQEIPGVVVLNEIRLSDVLMGMDLPGSLAGFFNRQLYRSHGYLGLVSYASCNDTSEFAQYYPCSRDVFESSLGVLVHSEHIECLAKEWYGVDENNCSVVPLPCVPVEHAGKTHAREALGLSPSDFVVCAFGSVSNESLSQRLLRSWLASELGASRECSLFFVGDCSADACGSHFSSLIQSKFNGSNVHVTGCLDREAYGLHLAAADLAVQLNSSTLSKSLPVVLDCMNNGLPVIVASGVASQADSAVWALPNEFTDQDLGEALETLWRDENQRHQLGTNARFEILSKHDPRRCAELYKTAIENFYATKRVPPRTLFPIIAAIPSENLTDAELLPLAQAIATTFPPQKVQAQLLIDVSCLIHPNLVSGAKLAVLDWLRQWLIKPLDIWRIEPVMYNDGDALRYARKFTSTLLGTSCEGMEDDPIDFAPGGMIFGLESEGFLQNLCLSYRQYLRAMGLFTKVLVSDFPVANQSGYRIAGARDNLMERLQMIAQCDGAVCTSKVIADELRDRMIEFSISQSETFSIEWIADGRDDGLFELGGNMGSWPDRLLDFLLRH